MCESGLTTTWPPGWVWWSPGRWRPQPPPEAWRWTAPWSHRLRCPPACEWPDPSAPSPDWRQHLFTSQVKKILVKVRQVLLTWGRKIEHGLPQWSEACPGCYTWKTNLAHINCPSDFYMIFFLHPVWCSLSEVWLGNEVIWTSTVPWCWWDQWWEAWRPSRPRPNSVWSSLQSFPSTSTAGDRTAWRSEGRNGKKNKEFSWRPQKVNNFDKLCSKIL